MGQFAVCCIVIVISSVRREQPGHVGRELGTEQDKVVVGGVGMAVAETQPGLVVAAAGGDGGWAVERDAKPRSNSLARR